MARPSVFFGSMPRTERRTISSGDFSNSGSLVGKPARVPAVAVGQLLVGLARGEDHLVGVDHDHVVAGVDVGGEVGAVLPGRIRPPRRPGGPGQTIGVDHVPGPLDLADFG